MNFAMIKARPDDGGADDDLGTFLAVVDLSSGCMRAIASETKGATDYLASSVADFVKKPVCWGCADCVATMNPCWLKPFSLELSVFVDTKVRCSVCGLFVLLSRSRRLSFTCAGVVLAALPLERFLVRYG